MPDTPQNNESGDTPQNIIVEKLIDVSLTQLPTQKMDLPRYCSPDRLGVNGPKSTSMIKSIWAMISEEKNELR